MAVDTSRENAGDTLPAGTMLSAWNVLLLILAMNLLLLWQSWASLADVWNQREAYSHGYLIAVISLFLVFRLRPVLKAESPEPYLKGFFLLGVFMFVWLVMRLAGIQIVELLLLPPILWAACLTVLGWRAAMQLAFPFLYLYFSIPVWHAGNSALQSLTVQATEILVGSAGFLAYIEGNRVFLSSGAFAIADGCSGLNFFIVAIAFSTLYGYLYLPNNYRRVLLVLIAMVFALVMNWLRVFIIIYAGYLTDMQHYLVTVDHKMFGWAMFALVLVPLTLVARRLEGADVAATGPGASVSKKGTGNSASGRTTVQAAALLALLLAATTVTEMIKGSSAETACGDIRPPESNNLWLVVDEGGEGGWMPLFVGVDKEVLADLSNGDSDIRFYANIYLDQSQGAELIGYGNRIEGEGKWRKTRVTTREVNLDPDTVWGVREVLLESGDTAKRLIYYWYDVDGTNSVSDLATKIRQGLLQIAGRPYAGMIAISATCKEEACSLARSNLDSWLKQEWSRDNRIPVYLRPECEPGS